jgi:hypothetical protein
VDAPRPLPGWLVGAALFLLLVPIWAFPYFPSQDGPTHVENARILLDYDRPDQPSLRVFYERSLEPVPNWFSHLLLSAFLPIVGPRTADKIFLTLYVLALPFAFRYALTAFRPDAGRRLLLVLPFVYNHFLHLGFYNLVFSAVPFFIVLGFWLRRESRFGPWEALPLVPLLLWLYFCHVIGFVLALAGLGALAGASAVRRRRDLPGALTLLLASGASAAPAVYLLFRFLRSRGAAAQEPGPPFGERLFELVRLQELVSYDPREAWIATALSVGLLAAAALLLATKVRRGCWHRGDSLLLVVAAVTAVYFAAQVTVLHSPGGSLGGGSIHDRVSLFVFLSLLLWLAVQPLGHRAERALVGMALAATVGLLAVRLPRLAELNDYLAEYLSAGATLPRDAVLLPLGFGPEGLREDGTSLALRVLPFLHAAAWIAAERGVVDLANYEADLGYFPVRFRPEANPYRILRRGLETSPPCVSLNRYDRLGPQPLEYILVWGARDADRSHPCAQAVFRHLDERYTRVSASFPRGLAELYRRKAGLDLPSVPR